jgi:hypothetical protein
MRAFVFVSERVMMSPGENETTIQQLADLLSAKGSIGKNDRSDMEGEMRFDIKPLDINLTSDNLRKTPDIESEALAKDMALVGLESPPIIVKYKDKYEPIDGARRTLVGQRMQNGGYEVTLDNGMTVTLKLDKIYWRVWLLKKTGEELGPDKMRIMRLIANESPVRFTKSDIATQIQWAREEWCEKMGLTVRQVGRKPNLHKVMVDALCQKFEFNEDKISKYLEYLRNGDVRVIEEGTKPSRYKKVYGETVGRALENMSKAEIRLVEPMISEAIKRKMPQTHIARRILFTKKEVEKCPELSLVDGIKERLSSTISIKHLSVDIPIRLHVLMEAEQNIKNISSLDKLTTLILEEHYLSKK